MINRRQCCRCRKIWVDRCNLLKRVYHDAAKSTRWTDKVGSPIYHVGSGAMLMYGRGLGTRFSTRERERIGKEAIGSALGAKGSRRPPDGLRQSFS